MAVKRAILCVEETFASLTDEARRENVQRAVDAYLRLALCVDEPPRAGEETP